MNQKEWSLPISCPQNVKMVVLNQNLLFYLLKSCTSTLLDVFLKKIMYKLFVHSNKSIH